jgi:hypothetical protein
MSGIRMNSNVLQGHVVKMYDAETNKELKVFESISKAGKFCGVLKGFSPTVYGKRIVEITWRGKQLKVYFKEEH